MNAARRSVRRREWPRGLYEPRPGYYVWRAPDGKTHPIGRVPLAVAKNEAVGANAYVQQSRPSLVDQLAGGTRTIGDVLDVMPLAKAPNTIKTQRSQDKQIRAALGTVTCVALTVLHCADLIDGIAAEGKARSAEAIRSRLIAVCKKAMAKGWMDANPAAATEKPEVEVQRGRLTLEWFHQIYAVAPQVNEWLQRAMMLALITGQDRSTIVAMQRSHVEDGCLLTKRSKTKNSTGLTLAIPLELKMDVVGVSLRELVEAKPTVVTKYLVHHVSPWGNAPTGSPVGENNLTRSFTEARQLAGIPDILPNGKGAPTFHEIRSLAKREYDKQGNVDTKALLGHTTERMSEVYGDPRGSEAKRVRVG